MILMTGATNHSKELAEREWAVFAARQEARGVDLAAVIAALEKQECELPSWSFGDGGTRFGVWRYPGAPRDVREKLADAAQVHAHTGITPSVALHIPWDMTDDWDALKDYAAGLHLRIGAINPNLFQDQTYRRGSLGHPRAEVREQAQAHVSECIEVMRATGSKILSLWLADGTDYPGQDSLRGRFQRQRAQIACIHARLPADARLLLEYKCFEPTFYSTDVPDWGTSYVLCQAAGPRAQVLVDTGHHLPGANIEQIVTTLLELGALGGFHFNSRKYADDDLSVGSIDPHMLFLIYAEIVQALRDAGSPAQACARQIAYMLDQSLNTKVKIPGMIQSIMNVQRAYAQALLVDWGALADARAEGNVVLAEEILNAPFRMDVAPLCRHVRETLGASADPLEAYWASGYQAKIEAERGYSDVSTLG